MHRRKWNAKTKLLIVLQGLQGKPVAELCTAHQISQSLYYQWRDHFLAKATKAFEGHQQSQKEARLARENARLKTLVGALTLE
jgi:transposase-like protein